MAYLAVKHIADRLPGSAIGYTQRLHSSKPFTPVPYGLQGQKGW